jgi:hypothetical protein
MLGAHTPARRLIASVGVLLWANCQSPVGGDALQPTPVVLTVPIDTRLFTADATLVAQIWNAEQLAALERNSACAASRNPATGTTEIRCPPGVQYQDVSPQKVEFSARTAGARLEIASVGIRAGEKFRIRVSGRSADNCNTTIGDQTSTAGSDRIIQVSLVWETTARACGKGDAL